MAHAAQRLFFATVKARYPDSFRRVRVLDCGSLNVNGTLRDFFEESDYLGVDIRAGRDVDLVSHIHALPDDLGPFDTVVSSEMLEHDGYWRHSLLRMYQVLKPGGLLVLSMAGEGRPEHGTRREQDRLSPDGLWGTAPDYYRNLKAEDLLELFRDFGIEFDVALYETNPAAHDLYFYGVKR